MTHNLDATVFVYRLKETSQIKCEYLDKAKEFEDDPDWEHMATLEPRMWIEHNWHLVEAIRARGEA
jgi:hypothetical protein